MAKGTPLGIKAKQYVDKGLLVPDDLTVAMVMDAVLGRPESRAEVLLDGFPRTVAQADALAQGTGSGPGASGERSCTSGCRMRCCWCGFRAG